MQVTTDLSPGFDLGAKTSDSSEYIIFNHLVFNVLIHKAHGEDMHGVPRRHSAGDDGDASGGSDSTTSVRTSCDMPRADIHT